MKLYKLDAIVLKSRDMREADKIITLYSVQRGKQRRWPTGPPNQTAVSGGLCSPFAIPPL
ncbi:hypothetical protein P378_17130 [Desulforamulus profundi]|uniref:DNA replication/recombination mediator RecO N-terminal domain-containing protein n=1 Tax=Desulforamulus profundi TaxID=1383067 RepID=A0A2C6MCK8_9FIRM|nr:hypothetical protein P378_17130 [Desulforamulus profundi]